jgi:signal transduction histidine kinase
MASSPAFKAFALPLLLFGCGAASVAAWMGGFYACLVLVVLLALWLATVAFLRTLESAPTPEARKAVPDTADEQAVLQAVLDQAPIPLLAVERRGRVRVLNRAARNLFAVDDLIVNAPEALFDGSLRLRHTERSYRVDRIEAQGAGATRTILALVDIESEERIAEARAMRELLQVLSHEVMNSLTPIASLAESALSALDDAPSPAGPLRDMVGTLARRAGGLLNFTQTYRELARLPEPTLAPTSLPQLFDDLALMFEARWSGGVVFAMDQPPSISVNMDRDQVSQALWALLQNGAEAALAEGRGAEVRLWARLDERLRLSVSDTGPGVPESLRAQIFQPFFTTKADGSGIGLSLARQIARGHGGDLALLSSAGRTTFELTVNHFAESVSGIQ